MKGSPSFDFDEIIERHGTNSDKWDRYKDRDVIPLWLADMDFRSPPAVIEALHRRVDHGVFGYTSAPDELIDVVIHHLISAYSWEIRPEWIVWLPGLVTGLNIACRAVGEDGDDVLMAVPVYPPFLTTPGWSRRNTVTAPLRETQGRWTFDFEALEATITPRTRLLFLCHPHNPVGTSFTRAELKEVFRICEKHNIVVCSDEIHCALLLDADSVHIPFASLSPNAAARTITLMAPSKTFNLPGLGCSFAIISNATLRRRFLETMNGIVPHVNVLGYTAALAAYRDSSDWHRALLDYLCENRDLLYTTINAIPGLSVGQIAATYLAWIDTRGAGITDPASFFEQAGVGLAPGHIFGGDRGFVRLTFGCPRTTLRDALDRMRRAVIGPDSRAPQP